MRLKYVFIKEYKNLKEFEITFDGSSFIDVFVGKNGSGKSNFFEALIKIFHHLQDDEDTSFNYKIVYEIDGRDIQIEWKWEEQKRIIDGKEQKSFPKTLLPDNVIVYYSGHNKQVSNLIKQYEASFSKKIKGANLEDSRFFIGIGSEYKNILLTLLLIQDGTSKASNHLKTKMKIKAITPNFNLILKKPNFANKRLKDLGFESIDNFEEKSHYWGADGITFDLLKQLEKCIKDSFTHGDIYDREKDEYNLPIDIELFQKEFEALSMMEKFRMFDNLKTLDMLKSISIELELENETHIGIEEFSDGQFQSIYIYAVAEIFKELNCLTLLDEPDAFLHPEWQFKFLEQVFDIADSQNSKNHILMSSHSASTITKTKESIISLFEFDGNKIITTKANKSDVIQSLSAGLISFTEGEASLNIQNILKNTTGAVLFTEGITDEMILETAWDKLYPGEEKKFNIQNAFSCAFLRNLMKDKTIYDNNQGRVFFSLFDFDEAFNDWNQLGSTIKNDPHKCLVKKYSSYDSYALLLPVPNTEPIKKQVINPHNGETYGNKSLLTIELLFYGISGLEDYFTVDVTRTDSFIKFISDGQKVHFAKNVVPTLDEKYFKVFEPIFEFIKSKCTGN
ncbi:AAA family ATPase [Aliarcobacter skirrowii]|uniref:ATP-dependent nuclease n=1 Tax=Aliarcobacter skirrowii TaxID=28200 RepID=UPI002A362550|nr:AAA family ATPase [Aliarcobacter skirrowii]MDY0181265.1 AAA family ATPase [Aliarcobacter skirrowii]